MEFFEVGDSVGGDDEEDGVVDAGNIFEFFGGFFDIFGEVVGEVFGAGAFGVEDDEEFEEFDHKVWLEGAAPAVGEGFVVVGFEVEFGLAAKFRKEI